MILTCLPSEQVQLRSQTKIWAAHQCEGRSRIVRFASSYLLNLQRKRLHKHFTTESSDSRGVLPPKVTLGFPYKEVFCSAIGVIFLLFASLYIFSFSLCQNDDSGKKRNHSAAIDLSLCLAVDLVLTFPMFVFSVTVLCPHIAARIVRESRLQHDSRHVARKALKDGSVPVFVAQRLFGALGRARNKIAERDQKILLAPASSSLERPAPQLPVFLVAHRMTSALERARARLAERHNEQPISVSEQTDDTTSATSGAPEVFNPMANSGDDATQLDWVPVEDPASRATYYYNPTSGDSRWEPPPPQQHEQHEPERDDDNGATVLDDEIELGDVYRDDDHHQVSGMLSNPLHQQKSCAL